MEELLKEVVLSERRKKQIDAFIQMVTTLLQAVPESTEVEVCKALSVGTNSLPLEKVNREIPILLNFFICTGK